ncbi:hypothetical protein [Aeoliella sp.]|uniref:hypothetical protein n=1 Tax=Aeoliella sp. TaxID=2795800 RepID=UPI003CCBEE11
MEIAAAMAKLARCPACYTELELPAEVADGDSADAWAKCPACEESFQVADAKPRVVKQAQLSSGPVEARDEAKTAPTEPATTETVAGGLNESLLDSFLRDGPTSATQPDIPKQDTEAEADATSLPSLGELKSLEDLFRGGKEPAESTATEETEAAESDFGTKETVELGEPSPVDDRRPTLGQMFDESKTETSTADSGSYDSVEEAAEAALKEPETLEPESAEGAEQENKKTTGEFDGMTLQDFAAPQFDDASTAPEEVAATTDDAPSFDQFTESSFGEPADHLDESKSLRASMGFPATDDPLEVQDEQRERVGITFDDDDDHGELSFAQVDAPRGVVASRKKKSSFSLLRTMIGVVLGGMFGLYAGYLVILWIKVDDPLDAARLYPDVVKPQALRSAGADGSEVSLAQGPEFSEEESTAVEDSGGIDPVTYQEPVDEPMPWEQQPAAPVAQETVAPVILDAPQYTAAQLQQYTAAAEAAGPALIAGGDIDRAKGSSYATIAKLAEALTFGEGAADASWNYSARQVFPPLFATQQAQGQISQIAGFWLTSPKRRHGGIFFCGTPDAGRQAGSVAEYQFTLPGGQSLTVLTPETLADNVTGARTVAVIGSVVYKPAERIEGYTGDEAVVIWSENLLPAGN